MYQREKAYHKFCLGKKKIVCVCVHVCVCATQEQTDTTEQIETFLC